MRDSPRVAFFRSVYGDRYPGAHRFTAHRETENPYLELLRMLAEAAGIEHSLMIAYLFAMFSIKEQYSKVRGDVTLHLFMEHRTAGRPTVDDPKDDHDYLELCTEEMQHLRLVNGLLGELGAAPNLMAHQFPLPADLYPFPLDLECLSRNLVAKYLWIEADNVALDPAAHVDNCQEERFIREVLGVLSQPPNLPVHVGSIYRRILARFEEASEQRLLPNGFPYSVWHDRLRALQFQGEIAHFNFFRDQFTGEAFGGDASIWQPGPKFPANVLFRGTAFRDYPDTIPCEEARRVAWFANLHYWILLMSLDAGYREQDRAPRYKAVDCMTQCLWHLGLTLAERWRVGMPFDQLGRNYGVGRDRKLCLHIVRQYATEALGVMNYLDLSNLLPERYDRAMLPQLIRSIESQGAKDAARYRPIFD
jgi:hypothetical protein